MKPGHTAVNMGLFIMFGPDDTMNIGNAVVKTGLNDIHIYWV